LAKQVPYGAQILFVDKKDDKLKMCIDYHALKKISIKNNYHLPHIDNLLDQFNGAKYFNQIDFKLGYYQICIIDEDIEKTTMRIKYGSYSFWWCHLRCVMPHQCSQPS
jgi:hypothetical protein